MKQADLSRKKLHDMSYKQNCSRSTDSHLNWAYNDYLCALSKQQRIKNQTERALSACNYQLDNYNERVTLKQLQQMYSQNKEKKSAIAKDIAASLDSANQLICPSSENLVSQVDQDLKLIATGFSNKANSLKVPNIELSEKDYIILEENVIKCNSTTSKFIELTMDLEVFKKDELLIRKILKLFNLLNQYNAFLSKLESKLSTLVLERLCDFVS